MSRKKRFKRQHVPFNERRQRKTPEPDDFDEKIIMQIQPPITKERTAYALLLLYQNNFSANILDSIKSRICSPETAAKTTFILIPIDDNTAEEDEDDKVPFFIDILLEDVIHVGLINKCGFNPCQIILFGPGDGGKIALEAAATWPKTEFGGVISVGGSLSGSTQRIRKSKTGVLLLGNVSPMDRKNTESGFLHVDFKSSAVNYGELPQDDNELLHPIEKFFAHRLRQEEWEKSAVLTFGTFKFDI